MNSSSKIKPDHPDHRHLVSDVRSYLIKQNFDVINAGCEILSTNRLGNVHTPTTLYVRGWLDLLAVHRELQLAILVECKTNDSPHLPNMAIEASSLLFSIDKVKRGVNCLYVYRDKWRQDTDKGFWVSSPPRVCALIIPPRWKGRMAEWFKSQSRLTFPGIRVSTKAPVDKSSKDPFFLIEGEEIGRLKDYRVLIEEKICEFGSQPEKKKLILGDNCIRCSQCNSLIPFEREDTTVICECGHRKIL